MHVDKHIQRVFEIVAAGERVSYMLHLRVQGATGAEEHAIRTQIKTRVCGVPYTFDLSPSFPVPFELRWLMPDALPTCNTFYVVGVDRNLNGRIITSHAQRMLTMVEREIKRAAPEHGQGWQLTCLVTQVFSAEPAAEARSSNPNTIRVSSADGGTSRTVESDPSESEQDEADSDD